MHKFWQQQVWRQQVWRQQRAAWTAALTAVTILWGSAAMAADPFRSGSDARPIGPNTQAAFETVFRQGNYQIASRRLEQALAIEPNEPMIYALRAALAYTNGELPDFGRYATQTREVAQKLLTTDPLRGHLYVGVGYFMEAGHIVSTQGLVVGTPQALPKVQQMFDEIKKAEKINGNDPELNLIKGFIDLMIAVNLPFSNVNDALNRLQRSAPPYLSWRGLAIGYRDLNRISDALNAVDRAILAAPDNPELYYLKAQIMVEGKRYSDSLPLFQKALDLQGQLPPRLVRSIDRERRRAERRANELNPVATPTATPALTPSATPSASPTPSPTATP